MKKVMVVLSMFLFPALTNMAYAAQTDEKCPGKAAFEENAKMKEARFIIQDIMYDLSDPLENMSDEQVAPLAVCYVTYKIAGKPLAQFVREQANAFEAKGAKREAARMRNFAGRIEGLAKKAELIGKNNDSNTMEHILSNMADPFRKLSDQEAAPLAQVYAATRVNGLLFVDYINKHADEFTEDVAIQFGSFVNRVESLAK